MEYLQKMAKANLKISYDAEENILVVSRGRKVRASIEVGDFIVDVDVDGFISGIEILNASETLKLSEEQLKGLRDVDMLVNYKPHYACIYLMMKFEQKEKERITIPLPVDLGHKALRAQMHSLSVA